MCKVPQPLVTVNSGGEDAIAASTISRPKRTWESLTAAPARARISRAPAWFTRTPSSWRTVSAVT